MPWKGIILKRYIVYNIVYFHNKLRTYIFVHTQIEEENTEFFPLRAAKCINDSEIEKHITDCEYNNALDAQMQNEQTTRI